MATLQEQIHFMQQELKEYQHVYQFLQEEFGEKQAKEIDNSLSGRISSIESVITSLQRLEYIFCTN